MRFLCLDLDALGDLGFAVVSDLYHVLRQLWSLMSKAEVSMAQSDP